MTKHQRRGMESALSINYISNVKLSEIAEKFLKDNGHYDSVPVDIEKIFDEQGIKILTVPRLKQDLSIDAYISSDFKTVVIDATCFEKHISRSRFSLAHELSHSLLHKSIYGANKITSITEYQEFQALIGKELEKRIESQAYALAGYILVPTRQLERAMDEAVLRFGGKESITITDYAKILDEVILKFCVSPEVILRRLESDLPEYHQLALSLTGL